MSRKKTFIRGTFILMLTGMITRLIGFFYRIFLSQVFGAEGVGLYQLIFPIYALGYALCASGIETTISRTVSMKIARGQTRKAKEFLKSSTLFSLFLSVLISLFVYYYANFLSTYFIQEPRTLDLLKILAYVFPFAALHSCLIGYYFGLKETVVPAIAQLLEQLARVGSIFLLYWICMQKESAYSISLAVVGLIIGEVVSSVFILFCVTGHKHNVLQGHVSPHVYARNLKELLPLSTPLTANRVTLNALHSIEAISIPSRLQMYGLSNSEALSTYGILVGMALPCLLFPTAITSSVSTMLLPTVAEIQATENLHELKQVVHKTITYCTLLGCCCLFIFFIFADIIGQLLFGNPEVGDYLRVLAWLCPFLYLNSTLLTIITAMGKPTTTFFLNATSLVIRIGFILFLIPTVGIHGYLWGLLLSQIYITLGCGITFKKLHIL